MSIIKSSKAIREYFISSNTKPDRNVMATSVSDALRIYNGRPLGKDWMLQRARDGWVVAQNRGKKTLESRSVRLREVNYSIHERFPM